MAEGTVQTIESSAPPQRLFDVALAIDSYPQWVTGVKEVDVLERDDEDRPVRARMVVDAGVRVIEYVLRYTYDPEYLQFSWDAEPGDDIKSLSGYYEFAELDDGGTEVRYGLRVEPAFPFPGFLRRQAEKHIITNALRGLKRRAEEA